MMCFPSLYPTVSHRIDFNLKANNMIFFNSGRAGLLFLVKWLINKYHEPVFFLPAYTCPSVVQVLEQMKVEFDFVDIGEDFDFKLDDLDNQIDIYKNKKIVLIPTALFGLPIRDYKKLYPSLLVMEDLSQSTPDWKSSADFQVFSFGRGKMVSSWNAGAVRFFKDDEELVALYNQLEVKHVFFKNYLLTMMQKIASNFFWCLISGTKYDLDNAETDSLGSTSHPSVKSFRIPAIMEKWLLTSLHKLKLPARKKAVHQYVKKMNRAVFFDFQVESSMLRFPVRKKISHVGIANTVDYHYTYKVACASRGREFDIPKILLTESSFLPTHELVNCEYINKIAALTYE